MLRAIDKLNILMDANEWEKAIKLAAKWPDLGEHKATIQRGASALLSPNFYRQIGQNPDELIKAAKEALIARYR